METKDSDHPILIVKVITSGETNPIPYPFTIKYDPVTNKFLVKHSWHVDKDVSPIKFNLCFQTRNL